MGEMLSEIEELQRELYSTWRDYDANYAFNYGKCRFCGTHQNGPQELHAHDCPRIHYVHHYYNITPYTVNERVVALIGAEYARRGVYGWFQTNDEYKELTRRA